MICWRCKLNKECDGLKIRNCKDFLPRTNGDRLREMTDEELAAWLFHHSMVCVPGKRPNPGDCVGGCERCWLDWLREEGE